MKLNHASLNPQRGEKGRSGKNAFLKYGALVSATTFALFLASVGNGRAEQQRQEQCSASIQRGAISSYTSVTREGNRIVNIHLFEENKYLQLTLPNSYMQKLGQAALTRPEGERPSFISSIVQNNIELALTKIGRSMRTTFECAPLTDNPAQAMPQPQSGSNSTTTASPVTTTAPPQPQPQPAPPNPTPQTTPPPVQDGGVSPDGGTPTPQRRRVIHPGGPSNKSSIAPLQQEAGQAIVAPIPPVRKGGEGTEKNPYIIEVPVPVNGKNEGTELARRSFSYLLVGAENETSMKIYIALRFVASSIKTVQKTSKTLLVQHIALLAANIMRDAAKARNQNVSSGSSSSSLNNSIRMIVENVMKESPDVQAYVANE